MSYPLVKTILVSLSLLLSLGIFSWRIWRLLGVRLQKGQPNRPWRDWPTRLQGLITIVAGQKRLFRFPLPGIGHFFIFWGFIVLSLTILQAITEGLLAAWRPDFTLPLIGELGILALLQDIFALTVTIAILYALYLRIIVDPERYKGSHKAEGVRVLLFIGAIMAGLLLMNGARIQLGKDALAAWRPVSAAIGSLLAALETANLRIVEEAAYWLHLGVVFIFLTELPGGKHFHVVTSVPAILLRNLDPPGRLHAAPSFNGDTGVARIDQFRRQQMLQFYTCTECGRCQEVCPAHASGADLSPKLLIMGLRDELLGLNLDQPSIAQHSTGKNSSQQRLIGRTLSESALWACSTCYACDQECPLYIEHIPAIVDLRRHLIMQGTMDPMLQDALASLGRYGNSFGKSDRARAKWTREYDGKVTDARREPVEFLWFVGDYASYHPALTHISLQTASLFDRAGLHFGILYDAERNAGNDVRRIGEEGLYEMLMQDNLHPLEECQYEAIVTTDPHSLNVLKNEYPWNDQEPQIMHHSELLLANIQNGNLALKNKLNKRVTYQDPCYLGRYNSIYDEPRAVIQATGCTLVEMPRHHDRAVCCGAGGGRIWMPAEDMDERPAEKRVREAASLTGVDTLVVSCPKDVTMYLDAIKTTDLEDRLRVKELTELVAEAL